MSIVKRPHRKQDGSPLSVYYTADGISVVCNEKTSASSAVFSLLPDVLSKVWVNGRDFLVQEVTYPDVIGVSQVVPILPDDEIFWARRQNREQFFTKFVKNRPQIPTNKVTVILKQREEDGRRSYIVIAAWFGQESAPNASDLLKAKIAGRKADVAASKLFWKHFAFSADWTPCLPLTILKDISSSND